MLKRRAKISPNFSMASMTDLIFLLLIFFMITSTMVSPNAIKVLLPQGKQQTSAKPLTRVIIDKNLNYYAAFGNDKELSLTLEELTPFLQSCAEREPEMYILHQTQWASISTKECCLRGMFWETGKTIAGRLI